MSLRSASLGRATAADALAICLDTCAEPRLDEIARLLGTSPEDARAQLGTLVFDEPATGSLVTAAEYLSGNVRAKHRQAWNSRALATTSHSFSSCNLCR